MAPAPYLFIASMDVEPEKLDLFNEVYDTEHVPMLMKVPGVVEITRLTKETLKLSMAGEIKEIVQGADIFIQPGTRVNVTFGADKVSVAPAGYY